MARIQHLAGRDPSFLHKRQPGSANLALLGRSAKLSSPVTLAASGKLTSHILVPWYIIGWEIIGQGHHSANATKVIEAGRRRRMCSIVFRRPKSKAGPPPREKAEVFLPYCFTPEQTCVNIRALSTLCYSRRSTQTMDGNDGLNMKLARRRDYG